MFFNPILLQRRFLCLRKSQSKDKLLRQAAAAVVSAAVNVAVSAAASVAVSAVVNVAASAAVPVDANAAVSAAVLVITKTRPFWFGVET